MSIQKKYVEAMNSHDVEQMVSLFADDSIFDDQANAGTGRPPIYLQGKEALRNLFTGFFSRQPVAVLVEERSGMDYDVSLNGMILKCRAEFTIEAGKIKYLKIRPRE